MIWTAWTDLDSDGDNTLFSLTKGCIGARPARILNCLLVVLHFGVRQSQPATMGIDGITVSLVGVSFNKRLAPRLPNVLVTLPC